MSYHLYFFITGGGGVRYVRISGGGFKCLLGKVLTCLLDSCRSIFQTDVRSKIIMIQYDSMLISFEGVVFGLSRNLFGSYSELFRYVSGLARDCSRTCSGLYSFIFVHVSYGEIIIVLLFLRATGALVASLHQVERNIIMCLFTNGFNSLNHRLTCLIFVRDVFLITRNAAARC